MLGITKISRQTVRNILTVTGVEPSPDRVSNSRADFLACHGETLWGCDFYSVKAVAAKGMCDLYVMVFLCPHPVVDLAWLVLQFLGQLRDRLFAAQLSVVNFGFLGGRKRPTASRFAHGQGSYERDNIPLYHRRSPFPAEATRIPSVTFF